MVLSGSLALVAAAYPPALRGRKIGVVSACTYAGLSLGPVLGGYVTGHFGWRYVFLMSVPIGLAGHGFVPVRHARGVAKNASGERMDWRGGFLYAVSVGLFMLGAVHAGEVPVGSGHARLRPGRTGVFPAGAGPHGLSPLLDVSLLSGNRFFTLSCLAALGNYAATFGITFLMSLYLQYAKGLSPRLAGLVLLSQPATQVFASLRGRAVVRALRTGQARHAGHAHEFGRPAGGRRHHAARTRRMWLLAGRARPDRHRVSASSSRPIPRPSWGVSPGASSGWPRA